MSVFGVYSVRLLLTDACPAVSGVTLAIKSKMGTITHFHILSRVFSLLGYF